MACRIRFRSSTGRALPGPEATFVTPTELRAVFAQDFRTPLLASWNLSLERQIGTDWVARVRLHRQQGHLLLRGRGEQPRDQPGDLRARRLDGGKHAGPAAVPDFSRIGLYESTNNSKYNSLQLNAEKRFGKGLAVLASYTFSKKMDDYGWTTPNDRRFDYGLSREDVPHNLKFSNVWQIPNGPTSTAFWAKSSTAGW